MASVSAIVADQRLAKTFYGVDPVDAWLDRPAFEAQGGLVAWRLSALFSRSLSRDWRSGASTRSTARPTKTAPLVQRTHGASVGLGLAYTSMRSYRTAND